MLSVFKGFLFVVFIICDGMSGVSVGKSITISGDSGRNKFLNMTQNSLKNVTDINFEGQTVDDEFCNKWKKLGLRREIDALSFKDCRFLSNSFGIFDHFQVRHLVLNNCNILPENIKKIFSVNSYIIRSIDLSNNNLGVDPKLFIDNLINCIVGEGNPKLILKGNNFGKEDQRKMEQLNKDYCCSIVFDF